MEGTHPTTDGERPQHERRSARLFRTLFVPMLVGFLAVPACFSVLPPQEALDRWNIATFVCLPIAAVYAGVAYARRAWRGRALLTAVSVVGGVLLANVGLASLPSIRDRRYCEADQRLARETLREVAASVPVSGPCETSPAIAQSFAQSEARHFSFELRRSDRGCALLARGEGFQEACDIDLSRSPEGNVSVNHTEACLDRCF